MSKAILESQQLSHPPKIQHHFQHIIFEKAEKPTLCDQEELCSNTIVPPSKASLDENICKF